MWVVGHRGNNLVDLTCRENEDRTQHVILYVCHPQASRITPMPRLLRLTPRLPCSQQLENSCKHYSSAQLLTHLIEGIHLATERGNLQQPGEREREGGREGGRRREGGRKREGERVRERE